MTMNQRAFAAMRLAASVAFRLRSEVVWPIMDGSRAILVTVTYLSLDKEGYWHDV